MQAQQTLYQQNMSSYKPLGRLYMEKMGQRLLKQENCLKGGVSTHVTQALQEKLGVKRQKMEMLHLNTFGGKDYCRKNCDVVKLCISKNDIETSIKALTHPTICSKLS